MIDNLYVFHGTDSKVGTTMLAQSVAEMISREKRDLKILMASLNGRISTEYVREDPPSIDTFKMHLDNHMINEKDFIKKCLYSDNLYRLAGVSNEMEERYYFPDTAKYLLETVAKEFDMIIVDAGNRIDNGLAVGALTEAKKIFLILTQQETALRRFEKTKEVYNGLGISMSYYILNKYQDVDPYSLAYIKERLDISRQLVYKVDYSRYSRMAEMDYKSLMDYKNDLFTRDIMELSNSILLESGYSEINQRGNSNGKILYRFLSKIK
ncbi:MAG: hypothetical protein ACOX5F_05900 [Anaerovoracaceae bacterium]